MPGSRLPPALGALVLALAAFPLPLAAVAPREPVRLAVIVAADSKVRDISHSLLRRIFLGETAEHEGMRFVPLNYPPGDPLRTLFDQEALGFSSDAAGRYWVDRRIRGQGFAPRAITSHDLMRAVVARLPGAIAYIAPDKLSPAVRAVEVDGASYDDPDYWLSAD